MCSHSHPPPITHCTRTPTTHHHTALSPYHTLHSHSHHPSNQCTHTLTHHAPITHNALTLSPTTHHTQYTLSLTTHHTKHSYPHPPPSHSALTFAPPITQCTETLIPTHHTQCTHTLTHHHHTMYSHFHHPSHNALTLTTHHIHIIQTRKSAQWLAGKMSKEGHAVALITGESTIEQRIAVLNRWDWGREGGREGEGKGREGGTT